MSFLVLNAPEGSYPDEFEYIGPFARKSEAVAFSEKLSKVDSDSSVEVIELFNNPEEYLENRKDYYRFLESYSS